MTKLLRDAKRIWSWSLVDSLSLNLVLFWLLPATLAGCSCIIPSALVHNLAGVESGILLHGLQLNLHEFCSGMHTYFQMILFLDTNIEECLSLRTTLYLFVIITLALLCFFVYHLSILFCKLMYECSCHEAITESYLIFLTNWFW